MSCSKFYQDFLQNHLLDSNVSANLGNPFSGIIDLSKKNTINNFSIIIRRKNPNLHNDDDVHLLVSCRDNSTNKRVISMSSDSSLKKFIKMKQLIPPSFNNNNFGQNRVIGPCNGIVCLYGYHDQIALCNPTIGDFKILPSSTIQPPIHTKVRGGDVGLGYDPNTDDYKVIHIIFCISSATTTGAGHPRQQQQKHKLVYQVEIYSLNSNSWRKYDSRVPANVMHTNIWSMVYKNNTFCWWAMNDDHDKEMILSFDMEKHVFQETPLPSNIQEFGGQKRTTRAIMPWKEQIGLVVYSVKEVDKFCDLWVLEGGLRGGGDHHIKEENSDANHSWIKVSRIGGIVGVERPLGFWKNGEILILESSSRELVMYDLNNKEITNLGIYGKRELLVYIPSLVSVNRYENFP